VQFTIEFFRIRLGATTRMQPLTGSPKRLPISTALRFGRSSFSRRATCPKPRMGCGSSIVTELRSSHGGRLMANASFGERGSSHSPGLGQVHTRST
jgi:hypothetical protein